MAASKFAGKKKAAPAKPKVSKMAASVAASEARAPKAPFFPEPGLFTVVCHGIEEGEKAGWYKAKFENDEIGEVVQLHSFNGDAAYISGPRVKRLAMALLGMTDEAEYDAFDGDKSGYFVDALQSIDHDASPPDMDQTYLEIAQELLGSAQIQVKVRRGKDAQDGDWYRDVDYLPLDAEAEEEEEEEDPPPPAKRKGGKK